jgi:calcineurin-like phosphoesterase family protein
MSELTISRRQMMKTSAGALLAAGLWPGMLAAADVEMNDFPFICVNDLHYVDEGCLPFFQDMVKKMLKASPNSSLLIVVGDLTEHGTPEAESAMRDILKTTNLTVKVVPGNHDWADQTDRKAYEELFPDSLNYTFEHADWQFVALDSTDGVKYENTQVLPPTLDWVDANLPKLDKKKPLILFTHFPLGPDVKYRVTNADALLDRFREYNLRAVFNGHYHGYTEHTYANSLITTDKCCSFRRNNFDGTLEKGFFACTTKDGAVTREFIEVSKHQADAAY